VERDERVWRIVETAGHKEKEYVVKTVGKNI
jgi:hypothetical protein